MNRGDVFDLAGMDALAYLHDHTANQTELAIMAHMLQRQGLQSVRAHDRGIFLGPDLVPQPGNASLPLGRSDGAYRSASGRYGVNLEVEPQQRGRNPSRAADAELLKQQRAMQRALRQGVASPRVQRTAAVAVEIDPNNPTQVMRIRHQTYTVQGGRVTPHVREVPLPPGGIGVQQAIQRGFVSRIRRPRPASRPRPANRPRSSRFDAFAS
jgi:hypothetical protein